VEEGCTDVSGGMMPVRSPARTLLVCAGNPCPCGFDGDPRRTCVCPPARADAYRARISGPVADRIDLKVDVPRLGREDLMDGPAGGPGDGARRRGGRAARE